MSQSGRFVVFSSTASNLVPGDTNGLSDVFVHDHVTGVTERVSVATSGLQGDGPSTNGAISDDGRFVAFQTTASLFEVPPFRTGPQSHIYVRDRQLGTTTREDFPNDGKSAGLGLPTISGNGRYVAFVGDDQFAAFEDGRFGPYVHDRVTGTTTAMPLSGGVSASVISGTAPSLSDDGSRITYSWVIPPPPNQTPPTAAFSTVVADTATATIVATVDSGTIGPSSYLDLAISGDGTKVVSVRAEAGLGTVFRFDMQHPGLVPIATNVAGPANPRLSDDGSVIAYRRSSDFVVTDSTGATTRVVSADTLGHPATSLIGVSDLSGDGQWIAFASDDPNLVLGDTNGARDVFLRSNRVDGKSPS